MSATQSQSVSWFDRIDASPWSAASGRPAPRWDARPTLWQRADEPLYTPAQRARRDNSAWTLVQGVLAPVQFLAFACSLGLVLRYLATGGGYEAATVSILVKTGLLFAIMITGSIWEKAVFGRYLFARAFFWEDVFSLLVLALHSLYVAALIGGFLGRSDMMLVALAAYASYVVNAAQFVVKLGRARRSEAPFLGLAGDPA